MSLVFKCFLSYSFSLFCCNFSSLLCIFFTLDKESKLFPCLPEPCCIPLKWSVHSLNGVAQLKYSTPGEEMPCWVAQKAYSEYGLLQWQPFLQQPAIDLCSTSDPLWLRVSFLRPIISFSFMFLSWHAMGLYPCPFYFSVHFPIRCKVSSEAIL